MKGGLLMPSSNKTFTVPEVADLLGLSEFTVRRRIKEGKLKAVMDSKKQGYKISEDSLMEYANSQNSKVGSLWKKGAVLGGVATTVGSQIIKSWPKFPSATSLAIGALAGFGIGKVLMTLIDSNSNSSKIDSTDNIPEISELNNIVILDKIIDRLNVELDDYDLQIEYHELKMRQLAKDSEQYFDEQEFIFQLKSQKSMICKEIKDLEIRRAILEQNEP